MKDILENDKKVKNVIIKELEKIAAKYGKDRKTTLVDYVDEGESAPEEFVEDDRVFPAKKLF